MASAGADPVQVEVAYGSPDRVHLRRVKLKPGSTVEQAVRASGLLDTCPEIDLNTNAVGIHGKLCSPGDPVAHGDRIEVYRPLRADPKEARRRRAAGGRKQ